MRVPEASMKLVAKSGLHYLIVISAAVPLYGILDSTLSRIGTYLSAVFPARTRSGLVGGAAIR
jgi:hypothetical protein